LSKFLSFAADVAYEKKMRLALENGGKDMACLLTSAQPDTKKNTSHTTFNMSKKLHSRHTMKYSFQKKRRKQRRKLKKYKEYYNMI
jgi:hypothetical protein